MAPEKCAAFSDPIRRSCSFLRFFFLLIASIGQAKVQIMEFDHSPCTLSHILVKSCSYASIWLDFCGSLTMFCKGWRDKKGLIT